MRIWRTRRIVVVPALTLIKSSLTPRAGQDPDARVRFMRIMTFYLSGWHIKPRG